jgi:nucleotide-binding universal stress UspA family protein
MLEVEMRILCATDLLPKSEPAIARAGLLANQLNADLSLLHVVSPERSHQELKQTLLNAVARTRSRAKPLTSTDPKAEVAVMVGDPARIIVETAEQMDADLLVLGAHRKRPWRDALEGTIAQQALTTRKYPVLVVRNEARVPYRKILLALDSSDASVSAIRAAESLVLQGDLKASVVHAHSPPYRDMLNIADIDESSAARYMREWKRKATCTVRDLLRLESDDPGRYHIHVEQKHTTPGIVQSVERFSPDLLVMGTRGAGRVRRALIGSVAHRVLRETGCDVLVVPEGSFGSARSELVNGARRPRDLRRASESRVQ